MTPDPRLALVTVAIHMTRHPRHPHLCRCDEFARAALSALPADEVKRERDQLRRWKQEAMPLFDGLQDLGRALGLPLGVLITGPLAIQAANTLRQERDAARAELARVASGGVTDA